MTTSPDHQLMTQSIAASTGHTLVVVDENLAPEALGGLGPDPRRHFLTNRCDIAQPLADAGQSVVPGDFDFAGLGDAAFDAAIIRLSKERTTTHYAINEAGRRLRAGGSLTLLGHKNEGLKSYGKRAQAYLASAATLERGQAGFSALRLVRSEQLGEPLPDEDYPRLRPAIAFGAGTLLSKPGIFGWQKIDRGSALLIEELAAWLASGPPLPPRPAVLDLGCGYGLLAVRAAQLIAEHGGRAAHVVGTDNNYAAVAACAANLARFGVEGEAVARNCGAGLGPGFDLVLCNPPFHRGFTTSTELTDRFVQQAGTLLQAGGRALFVVNEFIGLERRARPWFRDCRELRRGEGFKVLQLQR